MKCKECIEFDGSYFPNRCGHRSNVTYPKGSGVIHKKTADEINPDDTCVMGTKICLLCGKL